VLWRDPAVEGLNAEADAIQVMAIVIEVAFILFYISLQIDKLEFEAKYKTR